MTVAEFQSRTQRKLRNIYFSFARFFDSKYGNTIARVDEYADLVRDKNGIEIGGPSQIFTSEGMLPIYPFVKSLDGCNFGLATVWEGQLSEGMNYRFGDKVGHQYISEASDLSPIADSKYDFLVSSHCLEHCANPVKVLHEWIRVVRTGGSLILIVPHKQGTFDHRRTTTTLEHMVDDFNKKQQETDLTHLDEILSLHDRGLDSGSKDLNAFKERCNENHKNRCMHHHVFNGFSFARLIDHVGLEIRRVDIKLPFHIIIQAQKVNGIPDNRAFLKVDYYPAISPFSES